MERLSPCSSRATIFCSPRPTALCSCWATSAASSHGLLDGPNQVPALLAAMQAFGDATGQRRNTAKTRLLPVGRRKAVTDMWGAYPADADAASHVNGLRMVPAVRVLGVTLHSDGQTSADWAAIQENQQARLDKIARLPRMSAFGRAFAVTGYVMSRFLYTAQY
jgi:hypothetical protein